MYKGLDESHTQPSSCVYINLCISKTIFSFGLEPRTFNNRPVDSTTELHTQFETVFNFAFEKDLM